MSGDKLKTSTHTVKYTLQVKVHSGQHAIRKVTGGVCVCCTRQQTDRSGCVWSFYQCSDAFHVTSDPPVQCEERSKCQRSSGFPEQTDESTPWTEVSLICIIHTHTHTLGSSLSVCLQSSLASRCKPAASTAVIAGPWKHFEEVCFDQLPLLLPSCIVFCTSVLFQQAIIPPHVSRGRTVSDSSWKSLDIF